MVVFLLAIIGRDLDHLENKEDYHDDYEEVEVEAGVRDKHLLVVVFQEFLFHPLILVLLRDLELFKMHLDLLEQSFCQIAPLFVIVSVRLSLPTRIVNFTITILFFEARLEVGATWWNRISENFQVIDNILLSHYFKLLDIKLFLLVMQDRQAVNNLRENINA